MKGGGCHNKKAHFYCEVPTPGITRRWSPSSPPGSFDGSPHSLEYPPAHRVSFASAGIRTRHQELKVLREASLLPTELVPFYCEVPTPGPTRRWSPSSPPGSLDGSPHSHGYPPAQRVSFASARIRTRHQELKVLREASLLPTELLAQLVAGMLP